jgi:hypothetical protein
MIVIHFTHAAADPLTSFQSTGASFLPLADGQGDTHISCLHLKIDGKIEAPSIIHAAALLVVHGRVTIEPHDTGAILLLVEAQELTAHARAISTPQRIEGATWPSDSFSA